MKLFKGVSSELVRTLRIAVPSAVLVLLLSFVMIAQDGGQTDLDQKTIGTVTVSTDPTVPATPTTSLRPVIVGLVGTPYNSTRIHDALVALYGTKLIAYASVTAKLNGTSVELNFIVKPKSTVNRVTIEVTHGKGDKVTEQELLFKVNVLTTGTAITDQNLRANADIILDHLRERGYYRSEVTFEKKPVVNSTDVDIVFHVDLKEQAVVDKFNIDIKGLDQPIDMAKLDLRPGEGFSRQSLASDVEKLRSTLRKGDLIAPQLDEPRVTYDSDTNKVTIDINGSKGPLVTVVIDPDKAKPGESTLSKLLPIKKEGTLDYAAIVEGERRLENYYQEQGYFFADVTPVCSVDPPLSDGDRSTLPNGTEFLCSALASSELIDHKVEVRYKVDLSRRLKLTTIRIRGTDKLTYEDISTVLDSQPANLLGIIPLFGYGRGVTSQDILDEDASTVRSLMNELGYRDATVRVNQGVSPNSEDLIITFVVDEGLATVVEDVSIKGNTAFASDELLKKLPSLDAQNYSRARVRNAVRTLQAFYAEHGYFDARVTSSLTEPVDDASANVKRVKIELNVENEGKPVVIDRVMIAGNKKTKVSAIRRAIDLKPGNLLKSTDIYSSEQNLFGTDAFDEVTIKPQPAGNADNGDRKSDVIVKVNEQPPRVINYGGGFSTDLGVNGFFDIRHVNLFGRLWQGDASIRASRRQQLLQFDFVNPRFMRDKGGRFVPLTLTAALQRDSTVTRFFRSAFDSGTFGIVQRVDENNNPINEFGARIGSPTLYRLTLTAETSRTLSVRSRSIAFFRYKFEDVRLFNVDSLLVRDLLKPDSKIRTSGFSFTFVRDTRTNCQIQYSLLELIAKGEPGDKCRYNASDPTNGSYVTAQYDVSLPQLGANIGFHKFQASYNYYYSIPRLKRTTIAARAILGLATVFANRDRYDPTQFPGLEGILPISERFFAGGSTTIRGFAFEEAGPRAVIVPQGQFRNSKGDPVYLDPFTLPFGGNALAVVNIEGRIPLTKTIRVVPFYDGGNVFRRVSDIFRPPPGTASSFQTNLRALWTNTAGIGLRIKTPIGGEFGVDYGYLLNPPRFLIPQPSGPDAIYQLKQGQLHFRFSQAF